MAIRIGHASIGENGGRKNKPGDQTKKEVKISEWYANSWNVLLRPKTQLLAENMAKICETLCKNDCVGYDMDNRNTLHDILKAANYDYLKLNVPCETDCSAFMTLCAIAAGVKELEYDKNAPVCSTMKAPFTKTGWFWAIETKPIVNGKLYLRRGDILINTKKHTVMVLDNGTKCDYAFEGMKGIHVEKLQKLLASKGYQVGAIDGDFGVKTKNAVIEFQRDVFPNNPKEWDGIVGVNTWKMIEG